MHGTQKVLGCFGGYGRGTTEFCTRTLHIQALLAVTAFFTEFLGGIARNKEKQNR